MKARRILITGLPGVGKTTLCRLFQRAGLTAVDADDTPILKWGNDRELTISHATALSWLRDRKPSWDFGELERFLSEHDTEIYLFGVAPNMPQALRYFDEVVYLHVDKESLQARTDAKPYVRLLANIQGPIDTIFRYASKVYKKLHCIDGRRSPNELYRELRVHLDLPEELGGTSGRTERVDFSEELVAEDRRRAARTDRREAITETLEAGLTTREVAAVIGVDHSRVVQLVKKSAS